MAEHKRHLLLRHPRGFSQEVFGLISDAYEGWRTAVKLQIDTWATEGIRGTRAPEYVFHSPVLSPDRQLISITLEGDPGSYGALKRIEDGVPLELVIGLPPDLLDGIELSLVDEQMGLGAGHWYSAKMALGL